MPFLLTGNKREVDKRIGLIDALAECLSDTRQKSKVVHSLRSLLAQRIFAIAASYEDLNDNDNLRKDSLLQLADRTSCHSFLANQSRLLLSSAAYVLLESLRPLGLQGTELSSAQRCTIRLKLLKIGVCIKCSVRRVVLHLAEGYPFRQLLHLAASCLRMPSLEPT